MIISYVLESAFVLIKISTLLSDAESLLATGVALDWLRRSKAKFYKSLILPQTQWRRHIWWISIGSFCRGMFYERYMILQDEGTISYRRYKKIFFQFSSALKVLYVVHTGGSRGKRTASLFWKHPMERNLATFSISLCRRTGERRN